VAYRKTPVAARELNTTYHRLIGLIRFHKIDPLPIRDSSGDYLWSDEDMERARTALAAGRRKAVLNG
jgi:hypothetical protein